MNQSQTVAHILFVEQIERFQQFGTGQSELRGVAPTLFPLTTTTGGQFDADADIRAHTQFLSLASYQFQFVRFLHHNEYLLAHLLCQQCQFDVRLVLISVTDNDRVALTLNSNHCVQLRFRTSLNAQIKLTSVRDNLLNHRLHLIDLDGIDHIVLALVVVFLRSLLETAPRLLDTVVEDIGETQ